nr:MAG TPA: hypothetical protein [Caudoviricetes sp.]
MPRFRIVWQVLSTFLKSDFQFIAKALHWCTNVY